MEGASFVRRLSKSSVAVIVAVAVIGSLSGPSTSSFAKDAPAPDVFDPGPAARGSHDVPEPQGSFSEGRGRDHEVVDMRTSNSNTYVTSDGAYETEVFPGKVNYKDSTGSYQPIDNTLEDDQGNGFKNTANDYTVHLPADLHAPTRITQDGYWLSYTIAGASGRGTVDGRTATYTGGLNGVDVVVIAENEQLKEDLVLESSGAEHEFHYQIHIAPGLSLRRQTDGSLDVLDPNGSVRFTIPAPSAHDSAEEEAVAPGLEWSIHEGSGGTLELSVALDQAWLSDPLRVFPVILDPTISQPLTDQRDCTIVDSGWANSSQCAATTLDVGKAAAAGGAGLTKRALLRFDMAQKDAKRQSHHPRRRAAGERATWALSPVDLARSEPRQAATRPTSAQHRFHQQCDLEQGRRDESVAFNWRRWGLRRRRGLRRSRPRGERGRKRQPVRGFQDVVAPDRAGEPLARQRLQEPRDNRQAAE